MKVDRSEGGCRRLGQEIRIDAQSQRSYAVPVTVPTRQLGVSSGQGRQEQARGTPRLRATWQRAGKKAAGQLAAAVEDLHDTD